MTADQLRDRELLELAAKAAGLDTAHDWNSERLALDTPIIGLAIIGADGRVVRSNWNPLADDGDALRLLIRLGMDVLFSPEDVEVVADQHSTDESGERISPWALESWTLKQQDPRSATRRAIVRAAAEIGRSKHDR